MAVLSIAVTVDESWSFWKYLSEKEKIFKRYYFDILHIKDWSWWQTFIIVKVS